MSLKDEALLAMDKNVDTRHSFKHQQGEDQKQQHQPANPEIEMLKGYPEQFTHILKSVIQEISDERKEVITIASIINEPDLRQEFDRLALNELDESIGRQSKFIWELLRQQNRKVQMKHQMITKLNTQSHHLDQRIVELHQQHVREPTKEINHQEQQSAIQELQLLLSTQKSILKQHTANQEQRVYKFLQNIKDQQDIKSTTLNEMENYAHQLRKTKQNNESLVIALKNKCQQIAKIKQQLRNVQEQINTQQNDRTDKTKAHGARESRKISLNRFTVLVFIWISINICISLSIF